MLKQLSSEYSQYFTYSDVAGIKQIQFTKDLDAYQVFSFDMVTNRGTDVRTQTYILPEKDKSKADDLEQKINKLLSGDTNVDVCTLLAILNKKLNK